MEQESSACAIEPNVLCLPVKCTSIERKVALRNLNNIFGLFSEHSLHHCTDCFVNDADIKIISSSYLRISNFAECRMQFTGFYGQFPPCCNSPLFALDAKADTSTSLFARFFVSHLFWPQCTEENSCRKDFQRGSTPVSFLLCCGRRSAF